MLSSQLLSHTKRRKTPLPRQKRRREPSVRDRDTPKRARKPPAHLHAYETVETAKSTHRQPNFVPGMGQQRPKGALASSILGTAYGARGGVLGDVRQ